MTTIAPEDRTMAALTHLSGLAGYIIPFGGVIVPIIIWVVRKDSILISAIARQAVLLNLIIFCMVVVTFVLLITIILIPIIIVAWVALALAALALPIVGAMKASQGEYYKYPLVGTTL
jgi:uncharacterized Tic20 family protein